MQFSRKTFQNLGLVCLLAFSATVAMAQQGSAPEGPAPDIAAKKMAQAIKDKDFGAFMAALGPGIKYRLTYTSKTFVPRERAEAYLREIVTGPTVFSSVRAYGNNVPEHGEYLIGVTSVSLMRNVKNSAGAQHTEISDVRCDVRYRKTPDGIKQVDGVLSLHAVEKGGNLVMDWQDPGWTQVEAIVIGVGLDKRYSITVQGKEGAERTYGLYDNTEIFVGEKRASIDGLKKGAPVHMELLKGRPISIEATGDSSAAENGDSSPTAPASREGANLAKATEQVGSWNLECVAPARAELAQDDRALKVTVSAVGQKDWHAQVYQRLAPLQTGRSYTLTFAAKADKARPLVLAASVFGADYHDIGLRRESLPLTTEWRTFRRVFTASAVDGLPCRVPYFIVGNAIGTLWIRDVKVVGGQ